MKKAFLLTLMSINLSLFAYDQHYLNERIRKNIDIIDSILFDYDVGCAEYRMGFDYQIGFLNGHANAYQECLDLINEY